MKLPQAFPQKNKPEVDRQLQEAVLRSNLKIVALDDDSTGVQAVHHVPVYTDWSPESLRAGFAETSPLFFVLTNSRAMTRAQTARAHREIIRNITQTAAELRREFLLVSRS
ncbi:MAG: four-carbon acid sugar kinase family protein, partial [Bacillota bacterium]